MRPNSSVRPYRRSNACVSPAAELLETRILLAAPVANDDAVATDENTVLTGNVLADNGFGADSDADADPVTVAVVNGNAGAVGTMITLASGANLTVNADGSFTYDPSGAFGELALGESDEDTFTYRITDGTNSSNVATVTVTIAGANSPPVVTGESLQGSKNAAIIGNVLANDSDPDGDALAVSAVNGNPASVGTTVTLASGSTVRVLANGSFEYAAGGKLKRLEAGESAFDSFTYAVSDGNGGTGSATVTIRVNGEGFEDIVGYHQGTWQIGKSTGSAFATSVTQSANLAWDAIAYGDFNADGRTDVVGFIDGSWRVGLSNGSGFVFSQWAGWANVAWTNITVGDLNGDGRDDVMARVNGSWWAALSTGTSFAAPSRWATWANTAWQQVALTDLNSDGKADLLAYLGGSWWAGVSNGSSFGTASRWAKWSNVVWDGLGTFDFDDDGRTDIYGMIAGAWYVGRSNGTTFTTSLRVQWTNTAWRDIRSGDFNGDGKDDLAARAAGSWWVSFSGNGAGGSGGPTVSWANWSNVNWVDVRVGDFNGDGQDDIAGRYLGAWWVAQSQGFGSVTSLWTTWSDVAWQAVAAADFDGFVPQTQFSPNANAALWTQLSDDAEFAAKLLAI